jgi:hypothetical protein
MPSAARPRASVLAESRNRAKVIRSPAKTIASRSGDEAATASSIPATVASAKGFAITSGYSARNSAAAFR